MGTRSLTFVTEDGRMPIVCMYCQFDGYPSGHGRDLFDFLAPIQMVNGISGDVEHIANGAGCLAAQLVAHFKDGPGGVYLHHPAKHTDYGQEYEYWVDASDKEITVSVYSPKFGKNNLLFQGDVREFGMWVEKEPQ